MTYRIAHVEFKRSDKETYPVNCFRADFKEGDMVYVHMPERKDFLRKAKIITIQYLNWNCKNSVICLTHEYRHDKGPRPYLYQPSDSKFHTEGDIRSKLLDNGWKAELPYSKSFKTFFLRDNQTRSARIAFSKNAIIFQLFETIILPEKTNNKVHACFSEGATVRHEYYMSEVDLYELTDSYSCAFINNTSKFDNYFIPKGKKRPKVRSSNNCRDEMLDLYDAVSSDDGSDAYLGDGIWISSSGITEDRGR